jgi:hypothetical protein
MGKKKKDHRKKVLSRNTIINNAKLSNTKEQERFIQQIIEREKLNGNYDNVNSIADSTFTTINLDDIKI